MKNWIQKTFHTNEKWGRVFFLVFSYVVYLVSFYIVLPLLISILQGNNFGGWFIIVILFIIAPVTSFFIPFYFRKVSGVNKNILYTLHTIFVIIIPIVFLWLVAILAFSHAEIG